MLANRTWEARGRAQLGAASLFVCYSLKRKIGFGSTGAVCDKLGSLEVEVSPDSSF